MLKIVNILCICVAVALIFTCCRKHEGKVVDHAQADAMYAELLATYKAYSDSLSWSMDNDTTERAEALCERFEKKVWEINKRYPAETDFNLTPTQNDSLYHYFKVYLEVRNNLHGIGTLMPDTVATDTLSSL